MAKSDLTAQRLRELLHYEPETGVFTWRGRTHCNSRVAIGSAAGNLIVNGYLGIWLYKRKYPAHRLAVFWMSGEMPALHVDHINGVRTDNRFCNLREVTRSVNAQNRHMMNSTRAQSGLLGAHKARNKWMAAIYANGRRVIIGYFYSAEDAHAAYLAAKKELHHGWALSRVGQEASKDRTASA